MAGNEELLHSLDVQTTHTCKANVCCKLPGSQQKAIWGFSETHRQRCHTILRRPQVCEKGKFHFPGGPAAYLSNNSSSVGDASSIPDFVGKNWLATIIGFASCVGCAVWSTCHTKLHQRTPSTRNVDSGPAAAQSFAGGVRHSKH